MNSIVQRVRDAAGGPARLAEMLGITTSAVSQWRRIPVEHVIKIEAGTGIPRDELRPDVFSAKRPRRRRHASGPHPLRRASDQVLSPAEVLAEVAPEAVAQAEGGTLALPGEG